MKHGEKIEIVNLFTAELGNRELPEKFKRADVGAAKRQSGSDSAAAKTSPKSAISKWPLIGAAVLILIVVLVIGSFLFWRPSARVSRGIPHPLGAHSLRHAYDAAYPSRRSAATTRARISGGGAPDARAAATLPLRDNDDRSWGNLQKCDKVTR